MKKAYIIPKAKLISIDTESIIALSGDVYPDPGDGGYIDGEDAMSNRRESSLWGDREW